MKRFPLKFLSRAVLLSVLIGFVAFPYGSAAKAAGSEKVIENAITVLTEIKNVPEGGIPEELLTKCEGLAIFPSVYKGGFIVGAGYGQALTPGKILSQDAVSVPEQGRGFLEFLNRNCPKAR